MADLELRAVAFQEGDTWVVQGVDIDIAAQTKSAAQIPDVFIRALLQKISSLKAMNIDPKRGLRPAPERFKTMYERAETSVSPVREADLLRQVDYRDFEIRLSDCAAAA